MPIFHAEPHICRELIEEPGDSLQARDVLLIVLGIVKGRDGDQLRKLEMDAADLIDRYLPLQEFGALLFLTEDAYEQFNR